VSVPTKGKTCFDSSSGASKIASRRTPPLPSWA
jgi:hypothetical protein